MFLLFEYLGLEKELKKEIAKLRDQVANERDIAKFKQATAQSHEEQLKQESMMLAQMI